MRKTDYNNWSIVDLVCVFGGGLATRIVNSGLVL